jgi:glycosyltransferase involved in cell wall biosynthesis
VRTVLHVTPGLDYSGPARQLTLLARHLPRDRFAVRVCVLGRSSPWAEALRAAGVPVDVLGWTRTVDARPLLALRRLVREVRPDVVHAWGRPALRAAALAARPARLVGGSLLPPGGRPPGAPDRWLLRRVGGVVAFGPAEAGRYRDLGLRADRVAEVAPAVDLGWPPPVAGETDGAGVPADGRVVLCVGPLEAHKGFRDAVWAFDILRYLYDDLRLVLAGGGSDKPRVEDFARVTGSGARVHFPGPVPDLTPLRRRAALAWVPSRTGGGVGAALEAMAAGLPVIATRQPALAEVIADGETGLLVPPGDKAALARQTRLLLDDPALARRLGEAGRRAAAAFTPARLAEAYAGWLGG